VSTLHTRGYRPAQAHERSWGRDTRALWYRRWRHMREDVGPGGPLREADTSTFKWPFSLIAEMIRGRR